MGETASPGEHGEADKAKKGSASSPRRRSSDLEASGGGGGESTPTKTKRRKVNHACLYCRRSHMTCDLERPCTRCIKRNIGHLCHDEPREPGKRKSESGLPLPGGEGDAAAPGMLPPLDQQQQQQVDQQLLQENAMTINPTRPTNNPQVAALDPGINPMLPGGNEWTFGTPNQFHDMHNLHPFLFNAPEVTNEYTLLNDFLSTSLLDDGAMYGGGNDPAAAGAYAESSSGDVLGGVAANAGTLPPNVAAAIGSSIRRPPSAAPPTDKAQEAYYLTAADPSGNDAPDARINALLQAKYDAGLLRPFNYVKGYARLNRYMEQHMAAESRQKILRQLDRFRPKFRERMQSLTDVELVLVEMWFERCLMEYDRVFASMAVPACCWRRTGEIFRGNKEMAELIHVPIESLRDGKLAIHDIIVEEHLVSYWQKFGAIAFDASQKAMLTSCSLKTPDSRRSADRRDIPCCFSFTIRRDEHNIPSLIVGNFLPMDVKRA